MDRVALGEARTILFTYNIAEPDHVTFRKMLLLAEQVTVYLFFIFCSVSSEIRWNNCRFGREKMLQKRQENVRPHPELQ